MAEQEEKILQEIEGRLSGAGVTEIITVCPNCEDYMRGRVSMRVMNIYEKLRELGLGGKIPGGCRMFCPCPDREKGRWLKDIEFFLERECSVIGDIQCCGLGGNGGVMEPELAKGFAKKVKKCPDTVYTYCGSCAGNLTRNGCKKVRHVLPEILGTGERPDTVKSLINRMRTKNL